MRLVQLEARDVPAIVQTPIIKWEPVGPDPTINAQVSNIDTKSTVPNPAVGAIEEIALHPTDANIAFVASANGGVWRTTNATAARPAYTPLTDSAPALSVASMSLNSENPNQLIAGIGHQSAYAGVGGDFIGALYTDNALDPTPAFRVLGGALQNRDILAVVARNGYLLAAGTRSVASAVGTPDVGGVFRSLDDGATFTNLLGTGGLPDDVGKVFFLQPDPGNSNRVYVATATGLYKTENIRAAVPVFANITVALQKFGPVVATTVNAKLAVHNSAAGNVVYLSVTDDYALASVSYSTDFGATWTAMDLPSELGAGRKVIDATLASPIAIKTAVAHGFQTGDRVNVSGVKGNLGANGVWSVTVTAPDGFTLDQSAGTGIYTGGGQVASAQGVNPGGQGEYHSSLAADPIDPNVLYIAGDRTTVYRGNRSVPGREQRLPAQPAVHPARCPVVRRRGRGGRVEQVRPVLGLAGDGRRPGRHPVGGRRRRRLPPADAADRRRVVDLGDRQPERRAVREFELRQAERVAVRRHPGHRVDQPDDAEQDRRGVAEPAARRRRHVGH